MGQYYTPVIIDKREDPKVLAYAYSFKVGEGLKLMEHSYMGNPLVETMEAYLAKEPGRLVWAGDYARPETDAKTKDGYRYDTLHYRADHLRYDPSKTESENHRVFEENSLLPDPSYDGEKFRYVINYDKKEYFDKKKVSPSPAGWTIHPLPLLTAEGNGQGGGDYKSLVGGEFIGKWARDLVGVSDKEPDLGFDQIFPYFAEEVYQVFRTVTEISTGKLLKLEPLGVACKRDTALDMMKYDAQRITYEMYGQGKPQSRDFEEFRKKGWDFKGETRSVAIPEWDAEIAFTIFQFTFL